MIIETGGARISVDVAGPEGAPALLLIHAGIATRAMWDEQWADLARDHRVVRYDCRGFGDTRSDPVEFSNRADAIAVLDHLGLDRAVVVGASRGGSIALDTALEHPGRFDGVVMVGSSASGSPELPLTPEEEAAFEEIERLEAAGDVDGAIRAEVRLWSIGTRRTAEDLEPLLLQRLYDLHLANGPVTRAAEQGTPIPVDVPAVDRLGDLAVPLLILVGDADLSETVAHARLLHDVAPGSRLHVFSGAAHLPNVEQPAEFLRVLRAWLPTG